MQTRVLYRCASVIFTFHIVLVAYLVIGYTVPSSVYLDLVSAEYSDMCVGQRVQKLKITRNVPWAINAIARGEIFRMKGQLAIETVIHRHVGITYQKNEGPLEIDIEWDQPLLVPGLYGASHTITIYPLPAIQRTIHREAKDYQFRVHQC